MLVHGQEIVDRSDEILGNAGASAAQPTNERPPPLMFGKSTTRISSNLPSDPRKRAAWKGVAIVIGIGLIVSFAVTRKSVHSVTNVPVAPDSTESTGEGSSAGTSVVVPTIYLPNLGSGDIKESLKSRGFTCVLGTMHGSSCDGPDGSSVSWTGASPVQIDGIDVLDTSSDHWLVRYMA